MTTNPHRDPHLPRADKIAAAVLQAAVETGSEPWAGSAAVTVTELYHLREDDPAEVARFLLAAGHDTEAVIALAASAPHYGRGLPDAVVIELPGSTMANPEADPTDPMAITDPDHALPVRGARVVTVTADGIGGAMAAELTSGPSPVAHGPHNPDDQDALLVSATALYMARRTTDTDRRAIMDRLSELMPNGPESPDDIRAAFHALQDARPADPRPHWRTIYTADMDGRA